MGRRIVFDIESDGLMNSINTIWCMATKDLDNDTKTSFVRDDIRATPDGYWYEPMSSGLTMLSDADLLIGHNIIKFDLPALSYIYPQFRYEGRVFDTLLASQLLYPDLLSIDYKERRIPKELYGSHGLKAWGHRLGKYKGDYDDWTHWSDEMSEYNTQDVEVTQSLYNHFITCDIYHDHIRALDIEFEFARLIQSQEQCGVKFNREKALALQEKLNERKEELLPVIRMYFDDKPFTPKVNNQTLGYIKGVPIVREQDKFNPNSRKQLADQLISKYGWVPTEFTFDKKTRKFTTNPSLKDEVIDDLATMRVWSKEENKFVQRFPFAKSLQEYFKVQKLLSTLAESKTGNSWLARLSDEDRLYGTVNTLGAKTRRCTHQNPNLANIPKVKKDKTTGEPLMGALGKYGYECRDLFEASEGYDMVGYDGSGLEFRCLAHYTAYRDGGALARIVLDGDIHEYNREKAKLDDRETAKTFIYAFMYGAGDAKIGGFIGGGADEGKALKETFFAGMPALKIVCEGLEEAMRTNGYFKTIDGGFVRPESKHTYLNYLLQGTGAIAMKYSLVILDRSLKALGYKRGEDYNYVLNVHDEVQAEVRPWLTAKYMELAVESVREAGRVLGFKCPLDAEAKVGKSWAETH